MGLREGRVVVVSFVVGAAVVAGGRAVVAEAGQAHTAVIAEEGMEVALAALVDTLAADGEVEVEKVAVSQGLGGNVDVVVEVVDAGLGADVHTLFQAVPNTH